MIVGGVLIVLLVVSIAGYGFLNQGNNKLEKAMYNGVEFVKQSDRWYAKIGGVDFLFQYLPGEVENISVYGNLNLQNYVNKPLYFSGDGDRNEIIYNLGRYVERYQDACLDECEDLPVKNCSVDNVIIFSEDDSIRSVQNCVFIGGGVKGSDAFLYRLFGII